MVRVPIRGGSQMKPFQRRDFLQGIRGGRARGLEHARATRRRVRRRADQLLRLVGGRRPGEGARQRLRGEDRHQGQLRQRALGAVPRNLVTKFVGKAPLDVLWVSDAGCPSGRKRAGSRRSTATRSSSSTTADVDDFSTKSMTYKGKQYGLTYYTDYMAFFYNEDMLQEGGHSARRPRPGTRWCSSRSRSRRRGFRNIR